MLYNNAVYSVKCVRCIMFKKCNYLLWALAAGLWCFAGNSLAAGEMSLTLDSMADSVNVQKYAGLKFLPDLKDSETGWAGDNIPGRKPTNNCAAYGKTGKCPNNQDAADFCPFNRNKYKTCFCNGKKFPYSANNCYATSGAGNTQGSALYSGKICRQDGGGTFGDACGCTSSAYPYTNDASCGDSKKIIDVTNGCKINSTQRYKACKCKADYSYSSDISHQGYTCSSCSDSSGTHYKCTPTPCPSGYSTSQTTCSGMTSWKGSSYYSAGKQCGKCESVSNCGHFWNGDGSHTIPDSACSWDTYGHTATITVPSGKNYSSAWIRMWGNSTVIGDFTTGILTPGMVISNGGPYKQPRTITYKGLVTVTDKIRLEPGVTTVRFEKGVCGDFTCQTVSADSGANKWHVIKDNIPQGSEGCPKKNSNCPTTGCSRYFINSDGNITIPNGKCGWDAYGHTANVTTGTPKDNGTYEVAWLRMWGDSTVTNAFKTKELISGLVVSNGGYYSQKRTYTYKGKVTVNGLIKTDPSVTTSVFQGGIEGDYRCESWTGTGGNGSKKVADIQPGQPGCPCSQSKYKYNSSNCSGTPTGESCGGKYTDCEVKSNAQKCLDEGYRLKEDWPKPTASNDSVIPSTILANFMKNVFDMKSAHAAIELTTALPPQTPMDPAVPVIPGGSLGDQENFLENAEKVELYTFEVSATCPYDSNYVKGEWKPNYVLVTCKTANCKRCSGASSVLEKCTVCEAGYTLTDDGKCSILSFQTCNVDGCKTCVSGSTTKCAVCKSGYELSGNLCVRAFNPGTGGGCTKRTCNGKEYCCSSGARTPCDPDYSTATLMCLTTFDDKYAE